LYSYFNFFSASFCTTFLSAGIATSISVLVFSFLFLIFISGLFVLTSVCVCVYCLIPHYYYYYYCYYYCYYYSHYGRPFLKSVFVTTGNKKQRNMLRKKDRTV
jgi:hypothetical protein